MPLRIGIVVGEISGDLLGSSLVTALRAVHPDLEVEGIVGPHLLNAGCTQLFPMEELNVMGLIEPLARLPRLFKIRNWLIRYFASEPPDLFIGIDAPDFNLNLETHIRALGIPVVHYVSPSIWAWRSGRIHTIKKACDLMLILFPFETAIYNEHQVKAKFVGHPTADKIPLQVDTGAVQQQLGLPHNKIIVALLPGSRFSELKRHIPLYLETAKLCYRANPALHFITSLVTEIQQEYFQDLQQELAPELPLSIFTNQSYPVMSAADVVLVTSGTATLEVMLHQKPMLVAYKTGFFTYHLIKMLIKVKFIALPNLLRNRAIVPEFIQYDATAPKLSAALLELISSRTLQQQQTAEFLALHQELRCNASEVAAASVLELLNKD